MATRKRIIPVAQQIDALEFEEDFLFYSRCRWNVGYKLSEDRDGYIIKFWGDVSQDIAAGELCIYKNLPDEEQEFRHIAKLPRAPKGV